MSLGNVIEKVLNKNFSEEVALKYVGNYQGAFLSYVQWKNIREKAASGGVVSALLIDSLENNIIDGALVCKTEVIDHKVRAKFFIAETKEAILEAQGSTYVATKFSSEAIPLIREYQGRLAVVGLPCDLTILKNKNDEFKNKVVFTIALMCGHNSQKKLIDSVTSNLEKEVSSKLISYRFREGHWRGNLLAKFENNVVVNKPFSTFSVYQNLFFFAEKKCLFCYDHFGYDADFSIGDIWSYKLKDNPIKHNVIITKTQKATNILQDIVKRKTLYIESISLSEAIEGQKRAAPFHYNISARSKVGRLFNLNIPDKVMEKVKWHEYISAFIVLFNWKWSQSKKLSYLIFKIPKPVMKFYLYILKGLESLK